MGVHDEDQDTDQKESHLLITVGAQGELGLRCS